VLSAHPKWAKSHWRKYNYNPTLFSTPSATMRVNYVIEDE